MLRSNLVRWMVCVAVIATSALAPVANASPVGGSQFAVHRLAAHSSQVFNVNFWAGERGQITVRGDGDTRLELRVYDASGLVASDSGFGYLAVSWNTVRTGSFRIEVINHGSVYNQYEIAAT
jgi:hypothetical protein